MANYTEPKLVVQERPLAQDSLADLTIQHFENTFSFHTIKGICYRQNDDIIHNPSQSRLRDLDCLPFPARHLLKVDRYNLKMDFSDFHALSVITSRGCLINCTFCSVSMFFKHSHKCRKIEDVLHEIDIVEDIAIAYGYETFVPEIPAISTIGSVDSRETVKKKISIHIDDIHIINMGLDCGQSLMERCFDIFSKI